MRVLDKFQQNEKILIFQLNLTTMQIFIIFFLLLLIFVTSFPEESQIVYDDNYMFTNYGIHEKYESFHFTKNVARGCNTKTEGKTVRVIFL